MTPAVWGSPWNLRLVALDIETCVAPDNAHRIVSLGVAVCRDGGIRQRYEWLVQPGCPVDGVTAGIHGLTDRHLADEPTLDGILPELRRLLDPRPGETLVLAAHHAAFDLGWLRAEVERVGEPPLTDLPVLDTSGPLVRLAGLSLARPSLAHLLAALDLANERPHAALADATAAAEAAIALLGRADGLGHRDLDRLLFDIGGTTSATIRRAARRPARHLSDAVTERPVPPGHVSTHERDLPAAPTAEELAIFRAGATECAALRCEDLAARRASDDLALGVFLGVLDASASVLDVAGAATVLGTLAPLLERLPGKLAEMRRHVPNLVRVPGAGDRRGVALALHAWLAARLDPLGRCGSDDPCPACRLGGPCPLDTWRSSLVASALEPEASQVVAFWNTTASGVVTAKGAGRGYVAMRNSAPGLAEAGLRVCLEFHRSNGDPGTAALLADQVWRSTGCTDPAVAEVRARTMAAGGREADLGAAVRACRDALRRQNGSTDPAWVSLATRTAQLEARARRLRASASLEHRARRLPRKPRQTRFLRVA